MPAPDLQHIDADLLTGLRLNELLKSKWTDVDWDFRTLFVGLTKNGEPVLAPLSDAAVLRLQQIPRLENNKFIICGKNPGTHLVELRHVWCRVCSAANLPTSGCMICAGR
jgi:integrase